MIVDLADNTRKITNSWQKYKGLQAAQKDIQDTLIDLRTYETQLTLFQNNFKRISPRLSTLQVLEIQIICKDLLNSTKESRMDFEQNKRQVQRIRNLTGRLNKAESNLNDYWSTYANDLIEPYHELLKLVFHLQEVKRQQKTIQTIKENLELHAKSTPNSDSDLAEFDQFLEDLDKSLSNLQGLSPIISDFLERVSRGTFTLIDLNDEILEWCQVDDRGKSFKVGF